MLSNFFKAQLDYILFFYGFAFILLAVVCLLLRGREEVRFPWGWLGLFGLLHGINEWIDLLLYVLGKNVWFTAVSLGFMASSYICLIEFGRRGLAQLKGKTLGRWIYIPLICLGVLGGIKELSGLNASMRYALGFTGGMLSSWVLFIFPCPEKRQRRYLRGTAVMMFLYALASGLVTPKAAFFPAAILNTEVFFNITAVPIQLVRGLLAALVAMAICNYFLAVLKNKFIALEERSMPIYSLPIFLVLLLSLLGGWLITEKVSKNTDTELRKNLLMRIRTVTAAVNMERVKSLSGEPTDSEKPDFKRVKEQLAAIRKENPDCRFLYLMGDKKGEVIFLLDSEPADSDDYSPPGQVYTEASPMLKNIFLHPEAFIEGPYTDRWGSWVTGFAPIYDSNTGRLFSLVGMDIKAETWNRVVALSRIMPICLVMFFLLIITGFLFGHIRLRESSKIVSVSEKRHRRLYDDLQEAVEEVKAERDKAENYFDVAEVMFMVIDVEGKISQINKKGNEILGFPEQEIIGKDWLEGFIPERHRDEVRRIFRDIISGNTKTYEYYENPVVTKAGAEKLIAWHNTVLRDVDGNIIGTLSSGEDITERKRAGEALRLSEEKFSKAFLASADWISISSMITGRFIEVNEACCRILGYSREELIGHSGLELNIWSNIGDRKKMFQMLEEGVPVRGFELTQRKKNGELFYAAVSGEKIFINNEPCLLAVVRDVTELKKDEEEILKSKKKYEDLVNNLQMGIYRNTPGPQGHFIEANPAIIAMFEADSKEDFLKHNTSDLYKDSNKRQEFSDKMLEFGFLQREELELVTLRGRILWGSVSAVMRKDEDGQVYFDGMIEDITERKKSEEALKSSEEKFSRAFIAGADWISISSLTTGKFIEINEAVTNMLGYSREELLGHTSIELGIWVDLDERKVMVGMLERGEPVRAYEIRQRRKSGEIFYASISGEKININNEPCLIAHVRDVTERKNAETALRRVYEELSKAQQQLVQSEKLASLGRFSSGLAHEIKNPLAIMLGAVEFIELRMPKPKEEIKTTLNKIKDCIFRADNLIQGLLRFSRPSELKAEKVAVNDMVNTALELVKYRVVLRNIKIETDYYKDPLMLEVDKNQVQQVIFNAILNAYDAMPKGGTVIIKTSRRASLGIIENTVACFIEISDTGVGISKENLSRLFEPFFTTKREEKGVGLGLAVSKTIIENHNGKLIIESEEGKGTTVKIVLPLS